MTLLFYYMARQALSKRSSGKIGQGQEKWMLYVVLEVDHKIMVVLITTPLFLGFFSLSLAMAVAIQVWRYARRRAERAASVRW